MFGNSGLAVDDLIPIRMSCGGLVRKSSIFLKETQILK
jgi:hypothetical protein